MYYLAYHSDLHYIVLYFQRFGRPDYENLHLLMSAMMPSYTHKSMTNTTKVTIMHTIETSSTYTSMYTLHNNHEEMLLV